MIGEKHFKALSERVVDPTEIGIGEEQCYIIRDRIYTSEIFVVRQAVEKGKLIRLCLT